MDAAQLISVPQPLRQGHMLWAECDSGFSRFAYFEQQTAAK